MDSLFEYDPPSWYSELPERQAEITAEHIKARRETGVSNWDLYNLNSYYSSLLFTIAKESATREMGLDDEVKSELAKILQSAQKIEALEIESDEVFDNLLEVFPENKRHFSEKLTEIDKEQSLVKWKAIESFIFDILPNLPFKSEWTFTQANRDKHGLAQEDYEFIGSVMLERLATGVLKFQEHMADETNEHRGHPGNMTMEEWIEKLGQMRDTVLSLYPAVGKEYDEKEREDFMLGFSHLWI